MPDTAHRIQTKLTRMAGIEHPIILAPMAHVSGGKLAACVSRAGGLGLIGGGYGDQAFIEEQFSLTDGATVGIGFITWSLDKNPALLDLALSYKPSAVMLSFGDITPYTHKIKQSGCLLIVQVQNVAMVKTAYEQGADIIVVQGSEAGGHGSPGRSTLPLVPAATDVAGHVPIIAAGGIADGRGLAASIMLGASGVLMGSRFYACNESLATKEARDTAIRASGDQTVRSSVFDKLRNLDWPSNYNLRTLKNNSTGHWQNHSDAFEKDLENQRDIFQQALSDRDYQIAPVIVGEAIDLVNSIESANLIVKGCVAGAIAQIQSATHFTVT